MKAIGILGGMGPEATAELYLRIVRIFQQDYGAKYDADFPEMIIVNLPIPDVVDREEEGVKEMLIDAVKRMQDACAKFIVIPCNTVSLFIADMKKEVRIPILNIVEETLKEVKGRVGLIATEMTIRNKLYGEVITCDEVVTDIILNIMAGKKTGEDRDKLLRMIEKLKGLGAEKVILGCTELPLLLTDDDCIDTIDVLARAVVRESVGKIYKQKLNQGDKDGTAES